MRPIVSAGRVVGLDVARALALIGMMATHVFVTLDDNGNPTVANIVAGVPILLFSLGSQQRTF